MRESAYDETAQSARPADFAALAADTQHVRHGGVVHSVATFAATCDACSRTLPYPCLGDFAYGTFVLSREDGRAFRYLAAIGHPVWRRVEEILGADASPDVLQETVARVADKEENYRFTIGMVCRHCGSNRFRDWGHHRVGTITVEDATFTSFEALSQCERESMVAETAGRIQGEPRDQLDPQ